LEVSLLGGRRVEEAAFTNGPVSAFAAAPSLARLSRRRKKTRRKKKYLAE
jgi:hypothetical protein